ncbi:Ger(x)C family spore germination protein [Paenibacillus sp. GCM10023252]|uniref:Ger(x)C family spore germination protein n=1 Tax=Paenibacillus sp. GCM10023252 TaxID=3252649 RepID=UPI00360F85C4
MTTKTLLKGLMLFVCFMLLAGCWDKKDLRDNLFVSGIGVDYKEGQYTFYVQVLNFASIAKTEVRSPDASVAWVGQASDSNPYMAMKKLNEYSSQQNLYYGHVNCIVLGAEVLKKNISKLFEALYRSSDIRYQTWLFATDQSIEELFASRSVLDLSPELTLLHNARPEGPLDYALVPMNKVRLFLKNYEEAGNTVMLPSLSINSDTWISKGKGAKVIVAKGVYTFYNRQLRGSFPKDSLRGTRWSEGGHAFPLHVRWSNGEAVMIVTRVRKHITPVVRGSELVYQMKVSATMRIDMLSGKLSTAKLTEQVKEEVTEDIISTYERGAAAKVDLLGLEETLHKHHYSLWKKHSLEKTGKVGRLEPQVEIYIKDSSIFKL